MQLTQVSRFYVTGFAVRTSNAAEKNATTAKMSQLWERFYIEAVPKLTVNSKVYGLYSNYQSDFTGEFDITACATNISLADYKDLVTREIKPGSYLVFSRQGNMPQAVVGLWQEIWDYFNSANCQYTRAYETDFEYYKSDTEVEIYISVCQDS